MKHWWRFLGFTVATALVAYFIWFAASAVDLALLSEFLTPVVLLTLLGAGLLCAAIIPLTGWAWSRLLSGQGEAWPASWLTAVLAVTQLAKYIPGNLAQHASRAALALRAGMSGKVFAITIAQEILLALAASVALGFAMLSLSSPGLTQLPDGSRYLLLWAVPIALLGTLVMTCVHLPAARLLESRNSVARWLGLMGGLPGVRVALPAFAIYTANYCLIGFGLWLLARAASLPATLDLPLVTAAFALSWLLGFLAPGAPAGLGVREGILVLLLNGAASDRHLLAFVLLARLATMLGDIINFVLGTLWFAFSRGITR